jgi:hypothetical protein
MMKSRIFETLLKALEKIGDDVDPERLIQQLPDGDLLKLVQAELTRIAGTDGGTGEDQRTDG